MNTTEVSARDGEYWPVTSEVDAYLAALDRLVKFWRDGELTDEEFRTAKTKLLHLDVRPNPLEWPANVLIPLD